MKNKKFRGLEGGEEVCSTETRNFKKNRGFSRREGGLGVYGWKIGVFYRKVGGFYGKIGVLVEK